MKNLKTFRLGIGIFLILFVPLKGLSQNKITLSVTRDASLYYKQIDANAANTNYGKDPLLRALAWTGSSKPMLMRGIIDFDLSQIPKATTITKATLKLYADGNHSIKSGSNASFIQRVLSPWNVNTITWNNQPDVTQQQQVLLPASTSNTQNYEVDVTALVQEMIDYPNSSHGFLLKLQTEKHYRELRFASSDNSKKQLHPKLEVIYEYKIRGCMHELFLYNTSSTLEAYSIRLKPVGSSFSYAVVGGGWTQMFTPGEITWIPPGSQPVPMEYPINNKFVIWVHSTISTKPTVNIEWLDKKGNVLCTSQVVTPCYKSPKLEKEVIPYDFNIVNKYLNETIKVENGILNFPSYRSFSTVYDYLSSYSAEDVWEEINSDSISETSYQPFLVDFISKFPTYNSLFNEFIKKETELSISRNEKELSDGLFYNGFLDDELNAILNKNYSVIVNNKIYYFLDKDNVLEINNSANGKALYNNIINRDKSEVKKSLDKMLNENLGLLYSYDFSREIHPVLGMKYLEKECVLDDPCSEVGASTENVMSGIAGKAGACDLEFTPAIEIVKADCENYVFKDATQYPPGCVCDYTWSIDNNTKGTVDLDKGSKNSNLTWAFMEPGQYTVYLRSLCDPEDPEYVAEIITVKLPQALFSFEQKECGLDIEFKNESIDAISWEWIFYALDGITELKKSANQTPPPVTYPQAGAYKVVLKVKDINGCENTQIQYVEAKGDCEVDFLAKIVCTENDTSRIMVSFENKSTTAFCNGLNYSWNFGDGSPLSTQKDPQHFYTIQKNYQVCLTMNSPNAPSTCKSVTKCLPVEAKDCKPTVNASICQDGTVILSYQPPNSRVFGKNFFWPQVWKFPNDADKTFLDKHDKNPKIKFESTGTKNGNLSVKYADGFGAEVCECKVDYTFDIKSIECCIMNESEKHESPWFKVNNTNHKAVFKFSHTNFLIVNNIKASTRLRKSFVGLWPSTKADEIQASFSGTVYYKNQQTDCKCDVSGPVSQDSNIKNDKKVAKVKQEYWPFRTRPYSITSNHYVKKDGNIQTYSLSFGSGKKCH